MYLIIHKLKEGSDGETHVMMRRHLRGGDAMLTTRWWRCGDPGLLAELFGLVGVVPGPVVLRGLPRLVGVGVVVSLTLVADVGHVARFTVDLVLHLLQAAVGQVYVVESFGVVAVTAFLVTEVVSVVVLDLVTKVVLGLIGSIGAVGAGVL